MKPGGFPGAACAPEGGDWAAMFSGYQDLLTIKDVSEITGMTPQYLRRLAREGRIPAVRIGERKWYLPKTRFVEWLKNGGSDAG